MITVLSKLALATSALLLHDAGSTCVQKDSSLILQSDTTFTLSDVPFFPNSLAELLLPAFLVRCSLNMSILALCYLLCMYRLRYNMALVS